MAFYFKGVNMLKKISLSLMLFINANLSCLDKDIIGKILNDDRVQCAVAGAASAYFRPLIVNYFQSQPVRSTAVTGMIFIAHGLNIVRNNKNKTSRLLSTLFGAAVTAFIRNK